MVYPMFYSVNSDCHTIFTHVNQTTAGRQITLFWVALSTFSTKIYIFGTLYLRHKEEKGDSKCLSFRSNYHKKQNFQVAPANIQIIEITPLSQARNYGKQLCAHFLLFGKMYHFIKSTCIFCMILAMALCSPPFPRFIGRKWKWRRANSGLFWVKPCVPPPAGGFWNSFSLRIIFFFLISNSGRTIPTVTVLIHIFLGFSAENGNEDVPIQDYFRFSHALHLLPGVFRNSFSLLIITNPLSLQATCTDTPWKIVNNSLALRFCRSFFCVRVPDIISKLHNKKMPVGTRSWWSFIFGNGRPKISEQKPWWHLAKKNAWHDFMLSPNQH